MQKISWTDRVRNEEVLHRVKKDENIPHKIKRRKADWIGHILRRNCPLRQVIEGKREGKIDVMERRERKRKQRLDHLKGRRGYWKLKEGALDCFFWRTRFGKDYGTIIRQDYEMMMMMMIEPSLGIR
jgi:hypothetical protein